MTQTPQSAAAIGRNRWAGIPTNGAPADGVPQQDLAAMLDGLQMRLASQPVIEQSKGILMGHFRIDADAAFALLQRWSSCTNLKVRHISQMLITAAATEQCTNPRRSDDDLLALIDCLNQGRRPAGSF